MNMFLPQHNVEMMKWRLISLICSPRSLPSFVLWPVTKSVLKGAAGVEKRFSGRALLNKAKVPLLPKSFFFLVFLTIIVQKQEWHTAVYLG